MAEYKFQPHPDFEFAVSRAAMGGVNTNVRASRRRRTTLIQVGEEIIDEAKKIAARELPSRNASGGRDVSYPFAAPDRTGRTYTQSFGMRIERQAGRLRLIIFNNHEYAGDVEFGNANGVRRKVSRQTGFFTIPLSASGVARFRSRASSPEAKERARARATISYYKRNRSNIEAMARERIRLSKIATRNRAGVVTKSGGKIVRERQELAKRMARERQNRMRRETAARAAAAKLVLPRSPSFVKVNPRTGKPSLYTRSFHTYKGYAILSQATRRVTIPTLE